MHQPSCVITELVNHLKLGQNVNSKNYYQDMNKGSNSVAALIFKDVTLYPFINVKCFISKTYKILPVSHKNDLQINNDKIMKYSNLFLLNAEKTNGHRSWEQHVTASVESTHHTLSNICNL